MGPSLTLPARTVTNPPDPGSANSAGPVSSDAEPIAAGRAILTLTGPSAIAAAAVVLLAGLLVAWAGWRAVLVDRLRTAAARVSRTTAPDRQQ